MPFLGPRRSAAAVFAAFVFLALPQASLAQATYSGNFQGPHQIEGEWSRSGNCRIVRQPRSLRTTSSSNPILIEDIPSDFSCEPHRFEDGVATISSPTGDLSIELPDAMSIPDRVMPVAPPMASAAISGSAGFVSGGDPHRVLVRAIVGSESCSASDSFISSGETSRQIAAMAECGVNSLEVVRNSILTEDRNGQMIVTQFRAEMVQEVSIIMDHGNSGSLGIARGARYKYTIRTRYLFTLDELVDPSVEIISKVPAPDVGLKPGEANDIRLMARYTLPGPMDGTLRATAGWFHQGGGLIELANVTAPAPKCDATKTPAMCTVELALPGVAVPASDDVEISVELLDNAGAVVATESITCPLQTDLTLDHIEVVQVTQTPANTVPLVAEKSTVARVFVRLADAALKQESGIPVELRGTLNGVGLPGSPLAHNGQGVSIVANFDRANSAHSYDFKLPPLWSRAGALELTAIVNPAQTTPESNRADNTRSVAVTMTERPTLNIRYVPICIELPNLITQCPAPAIASRGLGMQRLFPVADGKLRYTRLGIPAIKWNDFADTGAKREALYQLLRRQAALYSLTAQPGQPPDQIAGWLPEGTLGDFGGIADALWAGGSGRVSLNIMYRNDPSFSTALIAHEVGHNLGLRHVNTPDSCNSRDRSTDWPHPDGQIQEVGYSPDLLLVLPPAEFQDIMSYCSPQWISPFHYGKLYDGAGRPQFVEEAPGRAFARPGTLRQQGASPGQLVSGSVSRTSGEATLDPVVQAVGLMADPEPNPNGEFCIEQQLGGAAAQSTCFDLAFQHSESEDLLEAQGFAHLVPITPNFDRIALLRNGEEIAALDVTPSPPTVAIQSPQAGETWNGGEERTITWLSNDADGGALTHSVLYSADGGATWIPIMVDVPGQQYTVTTAELTGGTQVHFRVIATDGVRSAEASVGPLTIDQAPEIQGPTAQPFGVGNTYVGGSLNAAIRLESSGTGPLTITAISSNDPAFDVSGLTLPLVVGAGETLALPVRFAPLAEEPAQGTITIESNATLNPSLDIEVTGSGTDGQTPQLAVETAGVVFYPTRVGAATLASIRLRNASLVDLETSWTIVGNGFTLAAGSETVAVNGTLNLPITFAPTSAGNYAGTVTITSSDPGNARLEIPLEGAGFAVDLPAGPNISPGGVVDAAQFQAIVAPGGIGSIFGSSLANETAVSTTLPLPRTLAGARVFVNGIEAPLFFVSAGQINFQIPFEVGTATPLQVEVELNGERSQASTVVSATYAPALFTYRDSAGSLRPIVTRQDFSLVTPENPASAGDVLIVWITGMGGLTSLPETGQGAPSSPLASALTAPAVTVGAAAAQVFGAAMAPGFVGLAQIAIQLPDNLAQGPNLPLVVDFAGAASPAIQLPVAGSAPPPPPTGPDVSVMLTSVTPATVDPGGTIDVAYSITSSTAFSGNVTRTIYLSADAAIDPNSDTVLDVAVRTLDAAASNVPVRLTDFTAEGIGIPANASPGDYFVAVGVSVNGDANPANDISEARALTINEPNTGPQLSVAITSTSPQTPVLEDNLTVRYTITNTSGFSGTADRQLYISSTAAFSRDSATIINTRTVDLAGADANFLSGSNRFPSGIAPGDYFLFIVLAPQGQGMDFVSPASPLTVLSERPPFDLRVRVITANPKTIGVGDQVAVDFEATGLDMLEGTFEIEFFQSADSRLSDGDSLLLTTTFDLIGGRVQLTEPNVLIDRFAAPGNYVILARVQTDGDTNPADNVSPGGTPITTVPERAPFDIGATTEQTRPSRAAAGATFDVTYVATNKSMSTGEYIREVYLSEDDEITPDDTLLSTRVLRLFGGDARITSRDIDLPGSLTPGQYFVGVIVEETGDTDPSDNRSNGVSFRVDPALQAAPVRRTAAAPDDQADIQRAAGDERLP